jgi:signal transduction histidine kinase
MLVTAPGELRISYQMAPEPVQVGRAREQARATLPSWGLADHAELAALIVSELISNAVLHGDGQIGVQLSYIRGGLRTEVHDGGRGRPVRRRPSADCERGRGLELIDGLIELYGGTRGVIDDLGCPGKTVYVTVCLTPDPEGTP